MRKHFLKFVIVLSLLAAFVVLPRLAGAQDDVATASAAEVSDRVAVVQAAGPAASAIQGTVDQYRAAVGAPNNGNGPSAVAGRREINWDGGSTINEATTVSGNPFSGFLITRG